MPPNTSAHEKRLDYLTQYRSYLLNIDTAPVIANPNTSDYEGFVLKSGKEYRDYLPVSHCVFFVDNRLFLRLSDVLPELRTRIF